MFGVNNLEVNIQRGGLSFSIRRALFNNAEQGMWYDLNDLSTLFTDSAGTTPATWGDPIGLQLDKHESDGRGVVNRLLFTEQFDNAWWTKTNVTVTANSATAPDGTSTADLFYPNSTGVDRIVWRPTSTGTAFTPNTVSVYAKASGLNILYFGTFTGGTVGTTMAFFNLSTGAVGQTGSYFSSASITSVGDGWYRCTATATTGTTSLIPLIGVSDASGSGNVTASGTNGVLLWGAQLELGSTATAYQANGASVGGPGNHRIQSTAGSRPILGRMPKRGRVNLVAPSENFADASWTKTNCSITAGVITTSATSDGLSRTLTNYLANTSHAWTFRVSTGTATWLRFVCFHTTSTANRVSGWFNLSAGVVGSATNGGTGTGAGISATEVSPGVYDVTLSGAVNNSAANITIQISTATADLSTTGVSGVTYSPIRTQLEAGAATAYQHVIDSLGFNITESGQPSCGYLSFNGSNQWMQTAAAVNFSATDEMSVFAGVRKVSDAAAGVAAGLSVDTNTQNGSFEMIPSSLSGTRETYEWRSKGTTIASAVNQGYAAPINNTLTGLAKIASPSVVLRVNGQQIASSSASQGTGNYGNHTVYFGARGGTSLYFNGLEFSTIIRGALTSGTLLTRTEQYVARQTPTVNL
jgi:hypothetical protein